MTKKKPIKNFIVNVDMKWSEDIKIKARSKPEARAKAWAKFKRTPKKYLFDLMVDEDY